MDSWFRGRIHPADGIVEREVFDGGFGGWFGLEGGEGKLRVCYLWMAAGSMC